MIVKIGRFHSLALWLRHLRTFSILFVLISALLVSCTGISKIGSANTESTNTVAPFTADIVFSSNRKGNDDIYLLRAENKELVRLTENMGNNTYPLWSPNGAYIAFLSDRDGSLDLYVMDADGRNPRNLSDNDVDILRPFNWSPDGTQIAFGSTYDDSSREIYVVDVRSGELTSLTDNAISEGEPTWSPSGNRIAYYTFSDQEGYGLSIVEIQTEQIVQLLNNEPWIFHIDWSPDGDWIVFNTTCEDGKWCIDTIKKDGSQRHESICGGVPAVNPVWSNKGDWIAFVGQPAENDLSKLCIVRLDGSDLTCLVEDGVINAPTWSPDDEWIVFTGAANRIDRLLGDFDIYAVAVDSGEIVNLTPSEGDDRDPDWRVE